MADSIRRPFLAKFDVFRSDCTEINIMEFLRSLITIPRSEIKNGGHFLLNCTFSEFYDGNFYNFSKCKFLELSKFENSKKIFNLEKSENCQFGKF